MGGEGGGGQDEEEGRGGGGFSWEERVARQAEAGSAGREAGSEARSWPVGREGC